MNAITTSEEVEDVEDGSSFSIQKLTARHKQALALMAQGIPMATVAAATNYTPTYIGMLSRMPICKEYIAGISEACDLQIEAMYAASVEAIGAGLTCGDIKEKLEAAKLQLKVTGRIGRRDDAPKAVPNSDERLLSLSERLVGLLEQRKPGMVEHATSSINAKVLDEVQDGTFSVLQSRSENEEYRELGVKRGSGVESADEKTASGNES